MSSTTLSTIIVVIYLCVIIGIIIWTGKSSEKTYKGFALGGGDIPWYVVAGTMFASTVGGGTMIGYVGNYKAYGFQWGLVPLVSFVFIPVFAGLYLAPRVKKLGQFTTGDMIGMRYGKAARYIAAGLNAIGEAAVVISMTSSFASMVNGYLGINKEVAIIVGLILFYISATMGGLKGVAWTDAIQACVIFVTVVVVAILCISPFNEAGGFDAIPANFLNPLEGSCNWWTMSGNILSCVLMMVCMQSLFTQRVNACKSPEDAKKATLFGNWACALFMIFGIGFIGVSAIITTDADVTGNSVVTAMLAKMPTVVGALYAAAIIAAVLTTANSMLLSSSMCVVRDFIGMAKPEIKNDDKKQINYSKIVMAVICVLAYFIVKVVPSIMTWILMTYTIIGCLAFPLYFGLMSKKATPLSGVLGLGLGGGVGLLWEILNLFGARPFLTNVHAIWFGLVFGIIGCLLGTLSSKKSTKEQLAAVDAFKKNVEYSKVLADLK